MRVEPRIPAEALAAIRAPFEATGASVVEPSVLQPLNLMLDLAGEPMRARLFVVQDEGGREACLRPDFTVAVVRDFVEAGLAGGRFRYEGKAFRVAPPGRAAQAEEFVQIGFEAFAPKADRLDPSEAPWLAWESAMAGGRTDLFMHISDVGLFRTFLADIGVPAKLIARLRRLLPQPASLADALEDAQRPDSFRPGEFPDPGAVEDYWQANELVMVGGRTPVEIVARLKRRAEEATAPRLTADQAHRVRQYLAIAGDLDSAVKQIRALTDGTEVRAKLKWLGLLAAGLFERGMAPGRVTFSAQVASPFVYYDDFMFDITSAALGPDRPVGGGGRYDSLVAQLGGDPETSAVGCVVRPWRAFAGGAG